MAAFFLPIQGHNELAGSQSCPTQDMLLSARAQLLRISIQLSLENHSRDMCRGLCGGETGTAPASIHSLTCLSSHLGEIWEKRVKSLGVHLCWPMFPMSKITHQFEFHIMFPVSINCLGTNLHSSIIACVTLLSTDNVRFELTTLPLQQGPDSPLHNLDLGLLKSPPLLISSSLYQQSSICFLQVDATLKNKGHGLADQHKVEIAGLFSAANWSPGKGSVSRQSG